ncbi:MAG: hypothetical protein IIY21_16035 [Clostridiales bacterium]|jgi:uncharacterized protein YtpQ (UPF0354 family)|nr:hypothetical protein [Clostridiales bacterium]MBQ1572113.1 hypothetical protein [Clostridiales bacterium]
MADKKYNKQMQAYLKRNYKRVSMVLSFDRDNDILKVIDPDNVQGSIKKIIREWILLREG